jgi:hypothetical protein
VFTKYDQFLRNVKIDMDDFGNREDVSVVAKRQFEKHYLRHLGDGARYVTLESLSSINYELEGQMLILF